MKPILVAQVTLSLLVLVCVYDVLCLPNLQHGIDNEVNIADSTLKVSSSKKPHGSPPYSLLWKVDGTEESIRSIQARLMRSYMNFSVDPCDDFYEYACGNWEQIHPIPKDKSENSVFMLLDNNIQNELLEVLSQSLPTNRGIKQELSAEDKARVYFASCTDEESINRRGVDPLMYFIDELGGWPVLDENWSEEGFDWLQLSIKTSLLGYPSILYCDVDKDLKNSTRYTIYVDEFRLGLSNREDFLNPENIEHLDAYRNLIVTVLRLLDVDHEKAEDTAKEVVDFEIQLANITTEFNTRIDLNKYISTTIEELSKNYSDIDWMTYLSGVNEISLHPNQSVVLLAPDYYKNLSKILKAAETRTIANYMIWRGVHPYLDSLDENFRAALQTFKEALTGQKEPVARWKECVKEANKKMGMATGATFVLQFFDEDSKNETINLLNDVKEAFRDTLLDIEWIDETTKELARDKVNRTKLAVGYPDFILNSTELNKLYNELQIIPGKSFENNVNLEKYYSRVRRKRFRLAVDKERWPSPPAVVNAFFEQNNNRIIIPAGILQPPVFHKHFPRALNYGAIGVFVGHELTHGFDDIGREFDSAGDLKPWWSTDAVKKFQEKEDCFIKQYSKFSVHGKFLQGTITKGENIADNGGIRQAFRVYRKWQNVNRKEKRDVSEAMPGLNLTNDQLFFLGFAQSWCHAIRPEAIENRIQTNYHCPGKFRVIGALSNFEEFSESFQCSIGSAMNPKDKCRLW